MTNNVLVVYIYEYFILCGYNKNNTDTRFSVPENKIFRTKETKWQTYNNS